MAAPFTDEKLEDQLRSVGKRLESPPGNAGELLALLDQIEKVLVRVQQSPSQSMLEALQPIKRLVVETRFLEHPNEDVKVGVASCVSEIIRITAPNAPYDDDLMKVVFRKIVDTFVKLDDIDDSLFFKRVSMLQTVAKVRSCLVMLDLECDDLILDMFHIFLRTIRPNHNEAIFSSMGAIMTVVLEESDEISPELISCLLDSVKNDNENILPLGRKLGERVITECAMKLKPYLVKFAKHKKCFASKYCEAVASILEENSDSEKQKDMNSAAHNTSSEKPAQLRKLDDRIVGARIGVWWPMDEMFYEGIVANYDPRTKKHKIVYDDGDVEILLLKKEKWKLIDETKSCYLAQGPLDDVTTPIDASLEEHPSKKATKRSNSVLRETNLETRSDTKLGDAGSTELPRRKGRPPKSGISNHGISSADESPIIPNKSKDKASIESKEGIPKVETKTKKIGEKDDAIERSRKFSDARHKTVGKTKDDSDSNGSKLRTDPSKRNMNEESHKSDSKPTDLSCLNSSDGSGENGNEGVCSEGKVVNQNKSRKRQRL